MAINEEWISYLAEDGFRVDAYLARPEGEPHGVMVLVEHLWGVDGNIQDVAKRLAGEGYLTLAPELYTRDNLRQRMDQKRIGTAMGLLFKLPPEVQRDTEQVAAHFSSQSPELRETAEAALRIMRGQYSDRFVGDLVAAAGFMRREHPKLKVGTLGFCMGGGLAARLAVEVPSLAACVIFYGANPPLDRVGEIGAPVLGLYGALDKRITDAVPAFAEAMLQAGKSFTQQVYPDAQHAFFDNTKPAYNAEAAADAWKQVAAFLRQNLG